MSTEQIYWDPVNTPKELHGLLKALSKHYSVVAGDNETCNIEFVKNDCFAISKVETINNKYQITYNQLHHASRGIGSVLSGVTNDDVTTFKTLGIMLDCSRNAVMKVSYIKKWLTQLSLMGYNMMMLYTEDTYELPGEPFFGYLRGGYSMDEIKEIDAYATTLGIEVIACIQTLGHLEQILQWGPYDEIKDTSSVLLVDEPKTYQLIEKMLTFWSEALKTRRIHIGLDETHDLGRGKLMDRLGYERGFDIFNRHLNKVNTICEKHGYKTPMIWSDMYFRMTNDAYYYYDKESHIPDDVKKEIPKNVELVYWDYYNDNVEFYSEWIKRHHDLTDTTLMGSGVWTWGRLWYDHHQTKLTVDPCIEACRNEHIDEIFFTLWGDDGAYCEFDSALAGLCYCAEKCYNTSSNDANIAKRFDAICNADYALVLKAGEMQSTMQDTREHHILTPTFLWDDPLFGIVERGYGDQQEKIVDALKSEWMDIKNHLEKSNDIERGYIYHAITILDTLLSKLEYRQQLLIAYKANDKKALRHIATIATPQIIQKIECLHRSLRQQWMDKNKPFGFEVIQSRLCTLKGRYEEVALRINELLSGIVTSIPELDVNDVPEGFFHSIGHKEIAFPQVSRF